MVGNTPGLQPANCHLQGLTVRWSPDVAEDLEVICEQQTPDNGFKHLRDAINHQKKAERPEVAEIGFDRLPLARITSWRPRK